MRSNPRCVDHLSAIPKYYQLAEILRQKIEDGEWVTSQAIPSEREIGLRYGVSRTTVREALGVLAKDGLISREQGRGTFVARPKVQYGVNPLSSFTDDLRARGIKAGQQVLDLSWVKPPKRLAKYLANLTDATRVLRLRRVRTGDGEPFGIHTAYLPLDPDQAITLDELLAFGSLYRLLETKFNLVPVEAEVTIEATLANEQEAAILHVAEGSPLLAIDRVTWSYQQRVMEYVEMLYRADRYKCYFYVRR